MQMSSCVCRALSHTFLLTALILTAPFASAHDPQAGAELKPQTVEGLGRLSFPTSTQSAPAQAAFVRGMLLLHLYEYPDAAKAFQEAEKLDPDFAMAYWGEALTATHALWNQDNAAQGRAALAKLAPTAEARAAKAGTARERAFLDAGEKLFGPGTLQQRDQDFLQAMATLAQSYPDDDEAQLFYAQALLGVTRGERNVENYLQAAAISKKVYERNPLHPGAAHYWIHGMDTPEHAAGALTAANALAKIAPTAGHAQHMVSHIFLALGMWKEVASTNERANAVVDANRQRNGLPPSPCGHYVEWLQYSYYQLGRHHEGQQLLDACFRDGRAAVAWMYAHPERPGSSPEAFERRIDGSLITMRAAAVVESTFSRAGNAQLPLATASLQRGAAWGAFARGWAAVADQQIELARAELAHLKKIATEPPGTEEMPRLADYLSILGDVLAARIAEQDNRLDEAINFASKAATLQDSLPVEFGPPSATKPPHEYVGELLLKAGRAKEALASFEQALHATPQRALSLLGKARALQALGNKRASKQAYADLNSIWFAADSDLAELAEVRAGAK